MSGDVSFAEFWTILIIDEDPNSSNPYNAVDYRFFIWRPGAILGEITLDYKQPLPWIIMITTDPIDLNFDSLWRVRSNEHKCGVSLLIYLIFVLLMMDPFFDIHDKDYSNSKDKKN